MSKDINSIFKIYMPILEYIDAYGIIEVCDNNHIIIAYKAFEHDYKLSKDLIYITNFDSSIDKISKSDGVLNFIISDSKSFFQKQFLNDYGFYLNEKLNSPNCFRIYLFSSYHPIICERVINNYNLAIDFVKFFKEHNSHIIDTFTEIKNAFDSKKNKYFKEPNNFKSLSDKENFFTSLKSLGLLKNDINVSDDEWKIIDRYNYSVINSVDTSFLFDMSKEEMKNKFNKIINKIFN